MMMACPTLVNRRWSMPVLLNQRIANVGDEPAVIN